jgi:hypothetical protein
MITNRIIQAWIDKANAMGTDVMRWSDFLDVIEDELRNPTTTAYTEKPILFDDLAVYADEAAAAALPTGQIYRTTTGEVRVKLAGS